MRKLFLATLIASVLAASTAFADERPSAPPVKGTEGPDVRVSQSDASTQPVKGPEGPGIR
jgi:hypothetical protein